MMIPKNSRSRRKQLSPHDSNDANKAEHTKALPTITRTSNHSTDQFSNSRSNSQHGSNDSQCSWVELDFDQTKPGKGGSRESSKNSKGGKPISSVNVQQYLVDDEENSSTTSNLSEDFTDKGEVPKGNGIDDDDDDDDSVTSFGSDSFAADVNFDDLLEESLRPSKSDLGVDMQEEALDEILEMGDAHAAPPTSYRSSATSTKNPGSESTKPESERSKGTSGGSKRQSRKGISPKPSKPKKKVSGKSKSPGAIQARKRISDLTANTVDEPPPPKEHKPKKVSKKSPGAVQARKRMSTNSDNADKKVSPKSKSTSTAATDAAPTRRRRLRSADGAEDMGEDESKEAILALKDGGSKPERIRTKSKSKHRKTPGRTRSSKNEDILRNSNSKEGDQGTGGATPSRELRKRYKKKALGHESDGDEQPLSPNPKTKDVDPTAAANGTADDAEALNGTTKQGRSKDRDGKKKIRSKSTDEKKIQRHSDGRRRRKKKPSKSLSMGDEPPPSPLQPDETPPPPPPETAPPVSDVEEEEDIVEEKDQQQPPEAEQPDVETMEKMTYSFHFRSEDEDENDEKSDKWLNSANSSSSSLSYNSFAQFSLDVGEMSGLVTDMNSLMESGLTMTNSPGFVPDLDASCQSVISSHSANLDASVVFMSGKSSKVSLLASHSFDTDDNDWDNDKSRSARSMPVGTSEGIRPEKQLRRRLKKSSGGGGGAKSMINSEIKKKVRRARSGGLEKLKDSMIAGVAAGKRSVGRTKSHNESLVPGSSKLVVSSAKRQERQEKSSRRKKEKQTSSAGGGTNKPKHAGKSKSAHVRELSASPRNRMQTAHSDHMAMFPDDSPNGEIAYNEKNIPLNDVDSSYRSPRRSPKERAVRRTYSNPCPSPAIHAVTDFAENSISPMSYDGGSKKTSRRSSPSRQALLSNDEDSDQDDDSCYSPHSNKKRSSFLPKRGLQRTPSSLLAGVRNHFKDNPGAGRNMLSQMKRTFSVSGRGKDVFSSEAEDISIGITTERGYVGANELRRRITDSANRKSQIKNSLYACMDDDDSSLEISSEIFEDGDSDDSGRGNRGGSSSVTSFNPRGGSDADRKGTPRRVNSLPIGARRNPN